MKAFNPDKELKKIQRGNKNKIIFSIIFGIILVTIGYSFALYQVRYSKRIIYTKVAPFSNKDIIIAVHIDNQLDDDFPKNDGNHVYDKIVCDDNEDKHVKAYWDDDKWALVVETTSKAKCDVYFKTGSATSTPNPPKLYQGLIPVTFGDNGKVIIADSNSTDWYNYDEKRWANAVLVTSTKYSEIIDETTGEIKSEYIGKELKLTTGTDSEVLQMYVWIPRYKYQLFNVHNLGMEPQEIKIKFESGTESTGNVICEIDSKGKETCRNDANGNWYTHPAFTFGNTELSGIWVGKFEPSGNDTNVKIIPNIVPIVNVNLSYMFNAARSIDKTYTTNFSLNSKEIDTHMMKNMEWGAMAYLTHSKYGRCDERGKCMEVTKNAQACKTGYDDKGNLWFTLDGQLASTTGNMYGIYDTNGDSIEYVMGNMVDASGAYYASLSGLAFVDEKYYDKYQYDASNYLSHERGHLGDATRETLQAFGKDPGGWYGDDAYTPHTNQSWINRSGRASEPAGSGTFTFSRYTGEAVLDFSFRVVLTAQDGDDPLN